MTENKMPDVIYLNDIDGDGVVDNFVWSSAEQIGQRQKYHADHIHQAALAEIAELRGLLEGVAEILQTIQFGFNHRRCPACAGWMMSEYGETDRKHTKDCPVVVQIDAYQAYKEKMDAK